LLPLESFQGEEKETQKLEVVKVLQQLAPSPQDLHPFRMAFAPSSPGHAKERGCRHGQWDGRGAGTELHSRSCPVGTWKGGQGLCRGWRWPKRLAEGICQALSPSPGEAAARRGPGLAPGRRWLGSAQPDLWADKQTGDGGDIRVEAVPTSVPRSF